MARRSEHDPTGRRALFEAPPDAPPDALAGAGPEGRAALFSTGPPRSGTVVVECAECGGRARLGLAELGLRMLGGVWIPGRTRSALMRCPVCEERRWCSIGWRS